MASTLALRLLALRERAAELAEILQRWPWRDTLSTLAQRFREDRLGLTASSLTFTTTIALVPLMTVTLALFNAFPVFGPFRRALENQFLQGLVPEGIAGPVLENLTRFALKANRLGTLGLVILVMTALALMLTIDRTLNGIWRVRQPRPIAQRVLVYWAAATLGPLLVGISLSMTSYLISAGQGWVSGRPGGGVGILLSGLEFLMVGGFAAALFHYVPNTTVRWAHALAGGAFVAVGLEVAKGLLGWYVGQVPGYSRVYGAFAALPLFLIWLYMVWLIVLFGAVIAAYAPSLQMRVRRLPEGPGSAFELALVLLRLLHAARASSSAQGLGAAELARRLRVDPLQLEPTLGLLVALDWIARLDEAEPPRYVLLVDPARTPGEPLIAQTLLAPGEASAAFRQAAGFERMSLAELIGRSPVPQDTASGNSGR
ncbi:YihY family inner membrane protein [Piscinibacter sp. Jin2]|uniref:UPF0761 membrane protein JI742_07445 n=1 Tax=Aquariibacter lacus TaxID=2801332 RepID=A0A9X0XHL4_9BURK|nr:YihY family inner membrane protein [Piscinibacter lacus]MBL0719720.1 YihY family inner membrane protein [Piscinibacter lacus]